MADTWIIWGHKLIRTDALNGVLAGQRDPGAYRPGFWSPLLERFPTLFCVEQFNAVNGCVFRSANGRWLFLNSVIRFRPDVVDVKGTTITDHLETFASDWNTKVRERAPHTIPGPSWATVEPKDVLIPVLDHDTKIDGTPV